MYRRTGFVGVLPSWTDRRSLLRFPSAAQASVRAPGCKVVTAPLRDVSALGCRIETGELAAGKTVWVTMGDIRVVGAEVRWSHSGEAGLSFATPLHPSIVAHLRGR